MKNALNEQPCFPRSAAMAIFLAAAIAPALSGVFPSETFTVEIDTPNSSTRTLVAPSDAWRYFKGTGEPNSGWEIADEVFLGPAWLSGAAGFGYGDGDDASALNDMQNGYSTVYARRTFRVDNMIDPARLKLRMDYDDGCVALLDGKEIARANAPGTTGIQPHHSTAPAPHEASAGAGGNAPETFLLPADFLPVYRGTPDVPHVLSIQGFNQSIGDDDFSLIPTLLLEDFYTLLTTPTVALSGKAALPGVASVTVNGQAATFNAGAGTWSRSHSLNPGMNRLVVRALDGGNNILAARTNDVVYKPGSTLVSGNINSDQTWSSGSGIVEVTGKVTVAPNVTLTIGPGVTVLFRPAGVIYTSGGTISMQGTSSQPIYLLPADGHTAWKEISANGADSLIDMHFVEMVAGRVHMTNYATAVIEDSVLRDSSHDAAGLEQQIVFTAIYCDVTMRRCRVSRYYEMAFGARTLLHMEDCVAEYAEDDAIKIDDGAVGTYVRRCTVGPSNPGDDGLDFGAGARALVDGCHIHHIYDRGISIGEVAQITVTNCLIHNVGNGIGVKDSSTAYLQNITIADSSIGLAVFEKFAGGGASIAYATNLIIWNNATNVTLRNPEDGSTSGSIINMGYSDVQGSYAGTQNINGNPLFVNVAADDYRLQGGSPSSGTGLGGLDRGAIFPVGAPTGLGIAQQPSSQTVSPGSTVTLQVMPTGNSPFTYQWRFNGTNIAGANSDTLIRPGFQAAQQGAYDVVVGNDSGSLTSAAALVYLNTPLRLLYNRDGSILHLRLVGTMGSQFALETSSNLTNWTAQVTNSAPTGIVDMDRAIQPGARYHRIRVVQ